MKNLYLYFVLGYLSLIPFITIAQTNDETSCLSTEYHKKCYEGTIGIIDNYIYLKSRPFSHEMEKKKFAVMMRRNTLYLVNVCEGEKANVTVNLYNKKGVKVASTYDIHKKKNNRALTYFTQKGGWYDISIEFKNPNNVPCSVLMYGMIKGKKEVKAYLKVAK